jgi:hypothetical protein
MVVTPARPDYLGRADRYPGYSCFGKSSEISDQLPLIRRWSVIGNGLVLFNRT